jgi:hypothetical protein
VVDLGSHGIGVAVTLIRALTGAADGDQVYREVVQALRDRAVRILVVCPAVREHAVDPAFEQTRKGPPVDWIDQHQRVGPIDPGLL